MFVVGFALLLLSVNLLECGPMSGEAKKITVAIDRCPSYERRQIKAHFHHFLDVCGRRVGRGERVLLKPNLVMARGCHDLACTHPEVVAAVAEYCLDCGAVVMVGDSPATGSGARAMATVGMDTALAGLGVEVVEFRQTTPCSLPCGIELAVARAVLECDQLINLAKVKAHGQVRLTLAVKNYFGAVKGWRKAWAHQLHGRGEGERFMAMLVELPTILPGGFSLADGVAAMHGTGPIDGHCYDLGLLAGSRDPFALDTAFYRLLAIDRQAAPLWQAALAHGQPGAQEEKMDYPLLHPADLVRDDFKVPATLDTIFFSLGHVLDSLRGRFLTLLGLGGKG